MALNDIRRDYCSDTLHRKELHINPLKQFSLWMDQAIESGIKDPTAMVLATVAEDGQPSQRIVLLKQFSESGFVFFTNYGSRKAQEILAQSKVSLLFPWHAQNRQVIVWGEATPVSAAESAPYFHSRPRDSQLAAWSSPQSREIPSREALEVEFEKMNARYPQGEIPLPEFWGGYRIKVQRFEFWQGGQRRLHDRFAYELKQGEWELCRLAP